MIALLYTTIVILPVLFTVRIMRNINKQQSLEFAKWIALNAQPLVPNIDREWLLLNGLGDPLKNMKVTTKELYELFLEHEKYK